MSFGLILLEVCDANLACSQGLHELEQEYPQISIIENDCMSICDTCVKIPYVYLNGTIISAPTTTELLSKLRQHISGIASEL